MKRVKLICFDAITVPGREILLYAKLARKLYFLSADWKQYSAAYFLQGNRIGEVPVSRNGFARLPHVFAGPGLFDVTVRICKGAAYCGESALLVVSSTREKPAVIVDIDHTIADISLLYLFIMSNDRIKPLAGAPETLRDLSREYDIIFVTRREYLLLNKTRAWLALHGFPLAPLFLWDFWRDPLRAVKYKTRLIRKLKRQWENIVIGIGDKNSDVTAYLANNMMAIKMARVSKSVPGVEFVTGWDGVRQVLPARGSLRQTSSSTV